MNQKMGADTLLVIPCCAAKSSGGQAIGEDLDALRKLVSPECYSKMREARAEVLRGLKADTKYSVGKYSKNSTILDGSDLGGDSTSGKYLPAIDRYIGTLYSVPGLECAIKNAIGSEGLPQIIILSALYGPLHPLSRIQDYNLMMSDAPARITWSHYFPSFLEEYVKKNGVTKIYLYLGTSTVYYKIAKQAVCQLSDGLITRAVQYHVAKGSTRNTPLQHGRRLRSDLGGIGDTESLLSEEIRENILRGGCDA